MLYSGPCLHSQDAHHGTLEQQLGEDAKGCFERNRRPLCQAWMESCKAGAYVDSLSALLPNRWCRAFRSHHWPQAREDESVKDFEASYSIYTRCGNDFQAARSLALSADALSSDPLRKNPENLSMAKTRSVT